LQIEQIVMMGSTLKDNQDIACYFITNIPGKERKFSVLCAVSAVVKEIKKCKFRGSELDLAIFHFIGHSTSNRWLWLMVDYERGNG